ncbi:uncharacterized protein E0L32_007963 [Thyridium curvatum]|uniref:Uncharacterized protein n=1 Tax=Thyridium curvatum TaxID=1093900 RepID=A0A507AML8_9PEZI|nr:uncharacterized protein E0L32_007963 [Thyridium curvatum]TPX11102.1 hypothetical protein E0L32_007963 [Thyridium curvatum]
MFAAASNLLNSFWQGLNMDSPNSSPAQLDGAVDFVEPSAMDVLIVKAMLQKGLKLPAEIVDSLLDHAEYWLHTTAVADFSQEYGDAVRVLGGRSTGENKFLVRTQPLGFVHHKYPDDTPVATRIRSAAPLPLQREYSLEDFQKMIASPEPMIKNPCRKIAFEITSRDQGWGGMPTDHGTYNHSWTWFDVGLERFDADAQSNDKTSDTNVTEAPGLSIDSLRPVIPELEPVDNEDPEAGLKLHHDLVPSAKMLQSNVVVDKHMRTHRITWSWTDNITNPESAEAKDLEEQGRGTLSADGEFVRNLQLGDVVTVWAKARFPGWVNHVQKVQVKVYWTI